MRALITGINGFVGGHLSEHLLAQGWEVSGIGLAGDVHLPALQGRVRAFAADLLDRDATREVVGAVAADVVFHLAAQSHVPTAFDDPEATISNNLLAQLRLLDAVRACGSDPVVVVACTGEEYGAVRPEELPVHEGVALRPNNPYAFSKVAQDLLALQYFLSYHVRTVRLRLFNHIGPRQSDSFVVPAFAHQIARIEAGSQEPVVRVGNLDARRDFTDVRDVVRAYELAALKGEAGEVYNIGSGQPVAIREILEMLRELSSTEIKVEYDPARMRPADVPVVACDASRFQRCTGWTPTIPLRQSLNDILQDWRERVMPDGE